MRSLGDRALTGWTGQGAPEEDGKGDWESESTPRWQKQRGLGASGSRLTKTLEVQGRGWTAGPWDPETGDTRGCWLEKRVEAWRESVRSGPGGLCFFPGSPFLWTGLQVSQACAVYFPCVPFPVPITASGPRSWQLQAELRPRPLLCLF